jgi:peptidoglycan hydrolase-like protein with peptidoglycan-binding domain
MEIESHADRPSTRSSHAAAWWVAGLIVLAAVLVMAAAATAAAPTRTTVPVYFLRGEQLAPVMRPGTTASDALKLLVAGPTPAEVKSGFRTYVPAGTRVLGLTVADGLATVDLSNEFTSVRNADSLQARLSQLVRTLTGLEGTTKVQLLIDGKTVSGVFPGIATRDPITLHYLQTPNVPIPEPTEARLPAPDDHVKQIQRRLIVLGYMVRGDDDGRLGPATQNALLAFQKWERLDRTGLLNAKTQSRLTTATRPAPLRLGRSGKRAEILLDRQVALLINNNKVVRVIPVSTGKPSTPTPPGDYRVYAKIPRWWSTPFREWLPWAVPFVGGIAFHEFPVVPTYPASHGCVRQSSAVARWTFDFAGVGMPVKVIARS